MVARNGCVSDDASVSVAGFSGGPRGGCLAGLLAAAVVMGQISASAEAPPAAPAPSVPLELSTRGMILQRWDRNRDGRIDDLEAERARIQLRRERIEREQRMAIDPLSGRRRGELEDAARAGSSPVVGRGRGDLPTFDSEPSRATTGEATTAPAAEATSTLLGPPTGLSPEQRPPAAGGNLTVSGSRPDEAAASNVRSMSPRGHVSPRGEVVTGGVRAGAPPLRPGYGAGGEADLNAGRLMGGLPASRGTVPQSGSYPYRGLAPRSAAPGAGVPRAGGANAGATRSAVPSAVGRGFRQPNGQPRGPQPRPTATTPAEFFGP